MVERPAPSEIPDRPGAYLFRDRHGAVLYVGKAKSLRKRVANYFTTGMAVRTRNMVEAADTVEWIVTENEVEAIARQLDERAAPVFGGADVEALHREEVREDFPNHFFVVDDENLGDVFPWASAHERLALASTSREATLSNPQPSGIAGLRAL